jgi:hypothetical protein
VRTRDDGSLQVNDEVVVVERRLEQLLRGWEGKEQEGLDGMQGAGGKHRRPRLETDLDDERAVVAVLLETSKRRLSNLADASGNEPAGLGSAKDAAGEVLLGRDKEGAARDADVGFPELLEGGSARSRLSAGKATLTPASAPAVE